MSGSQCTMVIIKVITGAKTGMQNLRARGNIGILLWVKENSKADPYMYYGCVGSTWILHMHHRRCYEIGFRIMSQCGSRAPASVMKSSGDTGAFGSEGKLSGRENKYPVKVEQFSEDIFLEWKCFIIFHNSAYIWDNYCRQNPCYY